MVMSSTQFLFLYLQCKVPGISHVEFSDDSMSELCRFSYPPLAVSLVVNSDSPQFAEFHSQEPKQHLT
jgi:hypothetical protein